MTLTPEAAESEQSLTIKLTNGARSIGDIYFANGNRNVFSYRLTQRPLIGVGLFLLLSGILYLLSMSNKVPLIFLLYLSVLCSVTFAVAFAYRANKYFKWKRRVKKYLREIAKYKEWSLTLRAQTFEVVNEKASTIEKWHNIKKASLSAKCVMLESENGDQYIFPAKAMDEKEFETLNLFVKEKVK